MTKAERQLLIELARVVAGHASAALFDGRAYVQELRNAVARVEEEAMEREDRSEANLPR